MNYYQSSLGGNRLQRVYDFIYSKYPGFDLNLLISHERPEQEIIAKHLFRDATVLEFGAGQGCTAIVIDKLLEDPLQHIILDPSQYAIECTKKHKSETGCQFQLLYGFMAKNRQFQEDLWPECKNAPHFCLEYCKSLISKDFFDVLIVDCEGAFLGICQDFPELLREAKLIIIEMDGDENNCDETRKLLKENQFVCIHSQCHPYYNNDHFEEEHFKSLDPKLWHNGIGFHEAYLKI